MTSAKTRKARKMGTTCSQEDSRQHNKTSIELMDKEIVKEFYESEDKMDIVIEDCHWLEKTHNALPEYWKCVESGVKHDFENDPRIFVHMNCQEEHVLAPGHYKIDYSLACRYETLAMEYRHHQKCLEKIIESKIQ
jgi:hypothetical protein